MRVTNSTIIGNSTANSNGGGIRKDGTTTATISNSIIAGNTAQTDGDLSGEGVNLTNNLIGIPTGLTIDDILDVNLADNGGPTWTHALVAGSPAINAGDNSLATDDAKVTGNSLATDQRGTGFERILGGTVDIGAIEVAVDYGDAPDLATGTATGDYETTAGDNGPSHLIVPGIFLGANIDSDGGTLQNATANADDVDGALPDDEDGVLSPLTDLRGTIGAAPSVTLLATNNTGSTAMLSGWIDFNSDGVFDNATERAQIAVPEGTTDERFTLTFGAIPDGFTGETYARFRLSTDAAANDATGAASDGEVEDYLFTITAPAGTPVQSRSTVEINSLTVNGPTLNNGDRFGWSIASLGDLDGDGIPDLAAGLPRDSTGGPTRGSIQLLLLNGDGSVKSTVEINSLTPNGPTLSDIDLFGWSATSLGDLNGDGVTELAVGALWDATGGRMPGSRSCSVSER